MAVDMFLKIDGIDGESKDSVFKGNFHLKSCDFGVEQVGTAVTGGGLGAGKAKFTDFNFVIDTQKGTQAMLVYCASGKHIPKVVLSCRKAGGKQEVYYTAEMKDCLITNVTTSIGEESTDTVTFNFVSLYVSYAAQKEDGTLEGPAKGGYDLKKNMAL